MKTEESPYVPIRVLMFLQVVSDIQRGFVTTYGLFLRGRIKRGSLSINRDYVFGQGIIDVVVIEEKLAIYPRIIVDEELVQYACGINFYTQREIDGIIPIENNPFC